MPPQGLTFRFWIFDNGNGVKYIVLKNMVVGVERDVVGEVSPQELLFPEELFETEGPEIFGELDVSDSDEELSKDTDPVRRYFREISRYGLLSSEEEWVLGEQILKSQLSYVALLRIAGSGLVSGSQRENINSWLEDKAEKAKRVRTLGNVFNETIDNWLKLRTSKRELDREVWWQLREQRIEETDRKLETLGEISADQREQQMGVFIDSLCKDLEQSFEASEKLTNHNLKLVVFVAKRYVGRGERVGLSILDLVQEGNDGLQKAVATYDYQKGLKFSTYATSWIKRSIQLAIANSDLIRIPRHTKEKQLRLTKEMDTLTQKFGRIPTWKEMAARTKSSCVLDAVRVGSIASLNGNGDGDYIMELGNSLPDPDEGTESQALTRLQNEELKRRVSGFLAHYLTPREREVFDLRFGFGDGASRTLKKVGKELGVTSERIRQIEMRALRKLRPHADELLL